MVFAHCLFQLHGLHLCLMQALEIDPDNAKGLYRRALVYMALMEKEMAKEGKAYWDLERTKAIVPKAQADISKALAVAPSRGSGPPFFLSPFSQPPT